MSTQICSKCGKEKEESEFYTRRKQCKQCLSEIGKKYREKNPEKVAARHKKYREENKEKEKERHKKYDEAHPENVKKRCTKYREANREACRERHKRWLNSNKDTYIEIKRKYLQSSSGRISISRQHHNRRVRLLKTPCTLTLQQWEKILETQGNKCAICGKRFCKSRPPTKDHIIPLSKGGGLTFENVQALCKSCNSSKNASLDHTKIITWSHNGITT